MNDVVVVGGGLAGLVASWDLLQAGRSVVTLEASGRPGGQIRTEQWHDRPVDVGAESMHLGSPPLGDLVRELGLMDAVVSARPGASWLSTRVGLRQLPAGVGPTGPTKIMPVLKSGIMSPFELARAGLEPLLARRRVTADESVGEFVGRRFGRSVVDTFVDPLLGTLHAGDIHKLSLRSTASQLLPIAENGRSLILRRTPKRPAGAGKPLPMFASWPTGLSTLIDTIIEPLDLRLNTSAESLERTTEGWIVHTSNGPVAASEVILAVPARVSANLLEPHSPGIAALLGEGRTVNLATVLLAYPKEMAEHPIVAKGNGVLLSSKNCGLFKAATFLSRKWAHLEHDELFFVRASAGRVGQHVIEKLDDEALAAQVHRELARLIELDLAPVDARVTRWTGTHPQLEVGHQERLAKIRTQLAGLPVWLAGAPYDGLGLPAVAKSGRAAARAVLGGR